jgi:hypothetical protein
MYPELFDPKYPYKANRVIKSKIDNEYGDYFQLTFFLIVERLKGDKSFYEPFISYLPKRYRHCIPTQMTLKSVQALNKLS